MQKKYIYKNLPLAYKNKPHPGQDNDPTYLSRGKGLIQGAHGPHRSPEKTVQNNMVIS